jgi:TRAP-type C4-dicarboxylate transport system substrate-binding protein
VGTGCRARGERPERGAIVLRLSHSMTAGPTALHVFGDTFRERAEAITGGAVKIRLFPSGTLGQEREVVQQLQEGLVDFMVSGTAIWGSVAPKLQVFDFPFLWRDWAHVHRVVDGGLKLRTIQSPIYVKAVELMGASPTPMAFGEVYTSLQTGVIDGYEHDASTTVQQRFYEVAHYMVRTRHIAGVLGLFASTASLTRFPPDVGAALERAAIEAATAQRARGPREDSSATGQLSSLGMTIRDIDGRAFEAPAERLWESEGRALGVTSWLRAIRA